MPINDESDTELTAIVQHLAALVESNRRIEGLLRVLALPILLSSLRSMFKDGRHIRAYELSDGIRSTREIGKMVGVDQKTVSRWWRAWEKEHRIIEKVGVRGQFKARYSLLDFMATHVEPIAHNATEVDISHGEISSI